MCVFCLFFDFDFFVLTLRTGEDLLSQGSVGCNVGNSVGDKVGASVGLYVGDLVGLYVGSKVGDDDGCLTGYCVPFVLVLSGGTIDDITGNIADLSALDGALAANGLNLILADNNPAKFTLFAPTDAAIGAYSGDITEELLIYHVVEGQYLADDVPTSATALTTVNGDEITVLNTNGVVTVTDLEGNVATVELANTVGVNGVVHVIDSVLSPMTIATTRTTMDDADDMTTMVSDMSTTMDGGMDGSNANSMNAIIALSIGLFAYLF